MCILFMHYIRSFKRIVHPKMKILSLVTHPHVISNVYMMNKLNFHSHINIHQHISCGKRKLKHVCLMYENQ